MSLERLENANEGILLLHSQLISSPDFGPYWTFSPRLLLCKRKEREGRAKLLIWKKHLLK
jgi:hypothetical protein